MITACGNDSFKKINLVQAEVFLEQNLLNNAVIEIEPGLQYKILEPSKHYRPFPRKTATNVRISIFISRKIDIFSM